MNRVLAVGEALVDVVHGAEATVSEHPGGSVANVAVALARLGQPVCLATSVGTDRRGRAVASWLAEAGVQITPGSTHAERTPTATAQLAPDGTATYTFDLTWAPPTGARSGRWADWREAAALHTGSLAALLEPGASAVARLVDAARVSATISYDPNIRPVLIDDAAATRRAVEAWIARADIVRASADDVAWMYPGDDLRDVARRWQRAGPAIVVITRGGAGAWAACRLGEVDHPGRPVAVVDTVGAGDTFDAGILASLKMQNLLTKAQVANLTEDQIAKALALGAKAAAVTVSRAGANPPFAKEIGL